MYKIYSFNYKNAESLINTLRIEKHPIAVHIKQYENQSEYLNYDLNYLIYYPIARIFHYKNTFHDMVKHKCFLDENFVAVR